MFNTPDNPPEIRLPSGTRIRFTSGLYSDYMPQLAAHMAAVLLSAGAARPDGSRALFASDLIRALPAEAFPDRATPWARHARVTRTLVGPVQVDGVVLSLERQDRTRTRRYEKSVLVVARHGDLPAGAAPERYCGIMLPGPGSGPDSEPVTSAVRDAVARILSARGMPASVVGEITIAVLGALSMHGGLAPPDIAAAARSADTILWPRSRHVTPRRVQDPLPNPPALSAVAAATAALRPENYLTDADPRILTEWEPDAASPFRGIEDPLPQLDRLRLVDVNLRTLREGARPHYEELPGLLEGLLWEPLPATTLAWLMGPSRKKIV